jgi:hypothetical protein
MPVDDEGYTKLSKKGHTKVTRTSQRPRPGRGSVNGGHRTDRVKWGVRLGVLVVRRSIVDTLATHNPYF